MSLSAKLVIIEDALDKYGVQQGRPFVGSAGNRLAYWWRTVGLDRSMFYVDVVVPYHPASIEKIPREEMEGHFAALYERLSRLDDPWLIIPTGNYGLYALTGKGKVSWHKKDGWHERPGIMDWRGSILKTELPDRDTFGYHDGLDWSGPPVSPRCIKTIPTIHPQKILGVPTLERRALCDWRRIAEESKISEINVPQPVCHIKPTVEDVMVFVDNAIAAGRPLSFDIETPRGKITEFQVAETKEWVRGVKHADSAHIARFKSGAKKGELKTRLAKGDPYIGCIGFSYDSDYAICVPLTKTYWKNSLDLTSAKNLVAKLLASDLDKVGQNIVPFDLPWLMLKGGYEIGGRIFDTRSMHHALDPRDDHDLAYLASVFTRFPFWKHEAKDPDEIEKYANNNEALWSYNCLDAAGTLDVFNALMGRLEAEGMLDFYLQHYERLSRPLLDMMLHGINVDRERMTSEATRLDQEVKVLRDNISRTAGLDLVADKGLSNDRLKFLFYGAAGHPGTAGAKKHTALAAKYPDAKILNLKPVTKKNTTGGRSITVDEVTINRLTIQYPGKLKELGPLLVAYRKNRKEREFLDVGKLDADGRMRCSYSFCTDAARLSSSSMPWDTGANLQNIKRGPMRSIFIPDQEVVHADSH